MYEASNMYVCVCVCACKATVQYTYVWWLYTYLTRLTFIQTLKFLFSFASFSFSTADDIIMSNMYIRDRVRLASDVGTNSINSSNNDVITTL